MKILFVVHRYAPFPGGSEYYVQNMAEEFVRRGVSTTVLAHEHQGDLNGVRVTNNYNILVNDTWDMIIVHGCDCISQNIALSNISVIKSRICYMIIKPSDSVFARHGMKYADFLAYSTSMDLDHILKYEAHQRARRVRHGIVLSEFPPAGNKEFYMSAGGFYPHKAMPELAKFWNETFPHRQLKLFGYADGEKPSYPNVESILGLGKNDVLFRMKKSFGYILNSYEEGFGLVLLEAMSQMTPVYARNIAGAKDMSNYVMTYDSIDQLKYKILEFEALPDFEQNAILKRNYDFVATNHTIKQTVDDLEDIIRNG